MDCLKVWTLSRLFYTLYLEFLVVISVRLFSWTTYLILAYMFPYMSSFVSVIPSRGFCLQGRLVGPLQSQLSSLYIFLSCSAYVIVKQGLSYCWINPCISSLRKYPTPPNIIQSHTEGPSIPTEWRKCWTIVGETQFVNVCMYIL